MESLPTRSSCVNLLHARVGGEARFHHRELGLDGDEIAAGEVVPRRVLVASIAIEAGRAALPSRAVGEAPAEDRFALSFGHARRGDDPERRELGDRARVGAEHEVAEGEPLVAEPGGARDGDEPRGEIDRQVFVAPVGGDLERGASPFVRARREHVSARARQERVAHAMQVTRALAERRLDHDEGASGGERAVHQGGEQIGVACEALVVGALAIELAQHLAEEDHPVALAASRAEGGAAGGEARLDPHSARLAPLVEDALRHGERSHVAVHQIGFEGERSPRAIERPREAPRHRPEASTEIEHRETFLFDGERVERHELRGRGLPFGDVAHERESEARRQGVVPPRAHRRRRRVVVDGGERRHRAAERSDVTRRRVPARPEDGVDHRAKIVFQCVGPGHAPPVAHNTRRLVGSRVARVRCSVPAMHGSPRLLALLALAPLLGGCPSAPPPVSQVPNAQAAIDRMRATASCGNGIEATAKIDHFGKQGRVRGDLTMIVTRPANIRMDVASFGVTLATLTSDARTFALADFREKRFYVGRASACNIARMTMVPIPGPVLVDILRGEAPVLKHVNPEAMQVAWSGDGYYVVTVKGTRNAEEEIHLAPRPDDFAKPWQLQRMRVLDVLVKQEGLVLYHAALDDHAPAPMSKPYVDPAGIDPPVPVSGPMCEADLPRTIHVEVPAQDEDVQFRYTDVTWNPPLNSGIFQQQPADGLRIVPVSCPDE